ncbi:hypothetical protein ACLOJK_021380 [Asimina triloba]
MAVLFNNMGKLGKKARKFAKKHLQSVLKNRRRFKSVRDSFKRRNASRNETGADEDHMHDTVDNAGNSGSILANGGLNDISLDALFSDDDNDSTDDASDSDGELSEDDNCLQTADGETESYPEGLADGYKSCTISRQNREIQLELAKQKRELDRLKEKDPKFAEYLEKHSTELNQFRKKEPYSDEEDEESDHDGPRRNYGFQEAKVLTSSTIDMCCHSVINQPSASVLPSLLNGFRAACYYGTSDSDAVSSWKIEKQEVFCRLMIFVLREADGIFRRLLGISSPTCKKETILELRNSVKWKSVAPLLKSYLKSALSLLNQVTDHLILEFSLAQLRSSLIFFVAFPSLQRRLMKISVHLWATGGGSLSFASFSILREMTMQFDSDCIDACMKRTYRAFIAHCKFVEHTNLKHIQFLADSVVELYSMDMQKSYGMALASVQLLAKILQVALRTKNKEALKKIYNWQFINCIDLWVKYVSSNIKDHDLQPLLYLAIQLINGMAHLFPGPRYVPLRLKCIQMLNQLSSSSGVFIPIASLALTSLEYKESIKADARSDKAFDFSSLLKVPKRLLKSQDFHEGCVLSAIELLSVHFAQWSYHISFPELATIPLVHLRKFYEKTTVEKLRCLVKRLIYQVEQNIEFVENRRGEVAFSPKDHASVDTFLQHPPKLNLQKCSLERQDKFHKIQRNDTDEDILDNDQPAFHPGIAFVFRNGDGIWVFTTKERDPKSAASSISCGMDFDGLMMIEHALPSLQIRQPSRHEHHPKQAIAPIPPIQEENTGGPSEKHPPSTLLMKRDRDGKWHGFWEIYIVYVEMGLCMLLIPHFVVDKIYLTRHRRRRSYNGPKMIKRAARLHVLRG